MGTKLYPPRIEGTLPAFWLEYDTSNTVIRGASITVPFIQNVAVSDAQIACFVLRLRTASTGSYLFSPIYSTNFNLGTKKVTFNLTSAQARQLNEGQYYKVQIAYCGSVTIDKYDNINGDDVGYFSTVGIIKCTSKPKVYINNLIQESVNFFSNEFVGTYDQSSCKDQTEKVYSYEFVVYDENNEIYFTTGQKLHQTAYDTEYNFSVDRVLINDFIASGVTYSIQYKVITQNELELSSPKYKLTNENLASPNEKIEIIPESNIDNGYITIKFKGDLDKDKSWHYLLNEENLESEKLFGEYIQDANGRTAFSIIQSGLLGTTDKISYLKKNTLFRNYNSNFKYPGFLYTMTNNFPQNRTKFIYNNEIRYILSDNFALIQDDPILSVNEKEQRILELPYYTPVESGRDLVKNLTYNYVEENHIDLNDYQIICSIPFEAYQYGSYILSRASNEDNYQTWLTIAQFRVDQAPISSYSFRDMTVEHGRKYKYGLQQSNVWGLVSDRITSKIYEVSFEDMFLFDGDKLLKIRFNPEVNTFKTTILEQKTDTIGGRFPYITRNGETYYKEFPIGGLIACEMDEDQMFHKRVQGTAHRHSTKALTEDIYDEDGNLLTKSDMPENATRDWRMFSDENIFLEREFKLAVLDWLNDGHPKLFKSPYEGNYIVRLMRNQLQPVQELGRMLHSFTSEAYEIAECTYENLVAYGFVNTSPPSDYVGLWRTYDFTDPALLNENGDIVISFDAGLESFTVQDMMPGDSIFLQYADNTDTMWDEVMIGITGSYTYTTGADRPVLKIKIHPYSQIPQTSDRNVSGVLHCYYSGVRITAFDSIIGQQLRTIPAQQYIGVNPWLENIRRSNWDERTSYGEYSFGLTKVQYRALQGYNFRDFLDDTIIGDPTNINTSYEINENFIRHMYTFDPGELLDRINATINKGQAYKIQLLNIEQAKFRLRDIIPVYVVDNNMKPKKYNSSQRFYGERTESSNAGQTTNYQYVSTSPYGYPHPIEELSEYEMIDPYSIYEVFEKDDKGAWYPVQRGCPYYDPYYHTWLRNYDPSFKINYTWKKAAWIVPGHTQLQDAMEEALSLKDKGKFYNEDDIYDYIIQVDEYDGQQIHMKPYYINKMGHQVYLDDHFDVYYKMADTYFSYGNTSMVFSDTDTIYWVKEYDTDISLATIKEKDYKELKDINSIHIGNGVIAELTFQIKVIDYYTEVRDQQVREAKQHYLYLKDFYDSLTKNYSEISKADYYRTKYLSLRNAYNKLLQGTNGVYLGESDKRIIRLLMENNYEIEQLKALILYNIEQINPQLDPKAIAVLYSYKMDHQDDNDNRYGASRLKFLGHKIESTVNYYAIDNQEIKHPSVNGGSDDKTIFRQQDSFGNIIYYAVDKARLQALYMQSNPNLVPVFSNLNILYSASGYNSSNITSLYVDKNTLLNSNITVEELSPLEEKGIIFEYSLLNKEDLEQLKLEDNFISASEVPYDSSLQTTFFEIRELKNISKENINYDVEGVANKVRDLQSEITYFNDEITSLLDLIESETAIYYQLYNELKGFLDSYNQDVYTSWVYQELIKLLSHQEFGQIRKFFGFASDNIQNAIDEIQDQLFLRLESCKNLYQLIKNDMPKILLYNQMQKDGTEDDNLDQYLAEQIIIKRGNVVLCIVAMYNAIVEAKSFLETISPELKPIYIDEVAKCVDYYNELYSDIADLSNHKIKEEFYNGLLGDKAYIKLISDKYKELYQKEIALASQSQDYVNPVNYATLSNYYEDLNYLKKWNSSVQSSVSATDSNNIIHTANNILPYSTTHVNQINTYLFNAYSNPRDNPTLARQFNNYTRYQEKTYVDTKNRKVYHYRSTFMYIVATPNDTYYTTFIFYPLANNRKDSSIPSNYANNLSYFESLSPKNKEKVLEVSKQLSEIVINFLDNVRTPNMGDRDKLQESIWNTYLKDGEAWNVEVLNTRRQEIITPPIDPNTGQRQSNAYTGYNNKILAAESALKISPLVTLRLSSTPDSITKNVFKVATTKAQPINMENINVLSDVYTSPISGEQTILPGYYLNYLNWLAGDKLIQLQQVLSEATKLMKLYEQQYGNYLSKYNKYNDDYLEYEAIFNSYSGTDYMTYYLDPNRMTFEDYRQTVKEAWWAFLSILDYKYTKEKERGMYK